MTLTRLQKAELLGEHILQKKRNVPMISFRFDDGNLSDYTEAFPRLRDAGLKGTYYIVEDWIGGSRLTPEQIREMADAGHEIGSHTKTHPHLTEVTNEQLINEFVSSKVFLEGITNKPCTSIAIPFGYYDERVDRYTHSVYENATVSRDYRGVYNPYGKLKNYPSVFMDARSFEWVKMYIDHAVENNGWLIIGAHLFRDVPVEELGENHVSPTEFQKVVNYVSGLVQQRAALCVTVSEGSQIIKGGNSWDITTGKNLNYSL